MIANTTKKSRQEDNKTLQQYIERPNKNNDRRNKAHRCHEIYTQQGKLHARWWYIFTPASAILSLGPTLGRCSAKSEKRSPEFGVPSPAINPTGYMITVGPLVYED